MSRYITLGADENGQVYGLELNEDGKWRRNPLGYSTACAVIRPMSKETYEYVAEDPESAKEIWQSCVVADKTELGLKEWFDQYVSTDNPFDASYVYELLDDKDNPTVRRHDLSIKKRIKDGEGETDKHDGILSSDDIWDEDGQPMPFRERLKRMLLESNDVVGISGEDDIYDWESSGWYPPDKPFAVELAPKKILKEYYAHLRKTYKEFKG